MNRQTLRYFEDNHTRACIDGDQLYARRMLQQMEDDYWHELEADIVVYMTHQRMVERQYWLDVSLTCEPVSD